MADHTPRRLPEQTDAIGDPERLEHELIRRNAIPHRKMPGSRRCIFVESEANRWLDGETLEAIALENAGRIVRPAYSSGTRRHERKRSETKVTAHRKFAQMQTGTVGVSADHGGH